MQMRILFVLALVAAAGLFLHMTPGSDDPSTPTAFASSGCADIDGDGVVHVIDIVMVSDYFGQTVPPAPPQVNIGKKGVIDLLATILEAALAYGTTTNCQSNPLPKTTLADGALAVDADGESTAAGDPVQVSRAAVVGVPFLVTVQVSNPPAYVGYELKLHWDEANFELTPRTSEENDLFVEVGGFVYVLQLLGPADDGVGSESYISLAAFIATPPNDSTYSGPIAQFEFTCEAVGAATIFLDGTGNSTALLARPATEHLPPLSSAQINCLNPAADEDGDGCTDKQEVGSNPALGGQRDPKNFWDFYDTPDAANVRDQQVDLFKDIFAVALRFGASGDPSGDPLAGPIPAAPAYHTTFDRLAPPPGGDPWDMQAADGMIDLFNDIFGIAFQFGHDCT